MSETTRPRVEVVFFFYYSLLFIIQLCTKVENWRRLGEVFVSVLQSIQRPNQLEQISGRVAIALLSDSKDKQAVPFGAFAETGEIRILHPRRREVTFDVGGLMVRPVSSLSEEPGRHGRDLRRPHRRLPNVKIPQNASVGQGKPAQR